MKLREQIEALRVPENPPDRDWGDEWEAYIHANAINRTIDAVLKLLDENS